MGCGPTMMQTSVAGDRSGCTSRPFTATLSSAAVDEGAGVSILPRGVGVEGEATTAGSSRGVADSCGVGLGLWELSVAICAEGSDASADADAPGALLSGGPLLGVEVQANVTTTSASSDPRTTCIYGVNAT